jgi:hypothetical protein
MYTKTRKQIEEERIGGECRAAVRRLLTLDVQEAGDVECPPPPFTLLCNKNNKSKNNNITHYKKKGRAAVRCG